MLYHILAIGDVTSEDGLKHLRRHLSPLKKLKSIDLPWSTERISPAPA